MLLPTWRSTGRVWQKNSSTHRQALKMPPTDTLRKELQAQEALLAVVKQAGDRAGEQRRQRGAHERAETKRGEIVSARGSESRDASHEDPHRGEVREAGEGIREDDQCSRGDI